MISSDFEAKLKSDDRVIIRLAGNNRYETSIKLAENTDAKDMVLVSGRDFADALSAINICNGLDAALLLTDGKVDSINSINRESIN